MIFMKRELFAQIPKVDELLEHAKIAGCQDIPRTLIVETIRERLDELRLTIRQLTETEVESFVLSLDSIADDILDSESLNCYSAFAVAQLLIHEKYIKK